MKRRKLKVKKDKKVFRHTAEKTRVVNVSPTIARGGIRLWQMFRVMCYKKGKLRLQLYVTTVSAAFDFIERFFDWYDRVTFVEVDSFPRYVEKWGC